MYDTENIAAVLRRVMPQENTELYNSSSQDGSFLRTMAERSVMMAREYSVLSRRAPDTTSRTVFTTFYRELAAQAKRLTAEHFILCGERFSNTLEKPDMSVPFISSLREMYIREKENERRFSLAGNTEDDRERAALFRTFSQNSARRSARLYAMLLGFMA